MTISGSFLLVFLWFWPRDIINGHLIPYKSRDFRWHVNHFLQFVNWAKRILRGSFCFEFYCVWLAAFYVVAHEASVRFIKTYMKRSWLWSQYIWIIVIKLRFINSLWSKYFRSSSIYIINMHVCCEISFRSHSLSCLCAHQILLFSNFTERHQTRSTGHFPVPRIVIRKLWISYNRIVTSCHLNFNKYLKFIYNSGFWILFKD